MSSDGSVTAWIVQICAGDRDATQKLWQRYFQRLVALARQKLRGAPRGMVDEEDVALNALDSFFRGAEQGRFPRLHDRDDLWYLLLVITERKAIDLVNHEKAQKRGGPGKTRMLPGRRLVRHRAIRSHRQSRADARRCRPDSR